MNARLAIRIAAALLAVAMLAVPASALAGKGGGKNKNKAFVVCKHGCKYRTIQKAVDKAKGKKNAVVKVKKGKYVEGVQVIGSKFNGLTIKGVGGHEAKQKTILDGTNAQLPGGVGIANNGIQVDDASKVTIKDMWVRDYAANGVWFRDSDTSDDKNSCKNFTADNVDVSFNRGYGLFAFGCTGGTFENSEGWGHGDSAWYIGATPFQDNPKVTVLKNLDAYENILGYSGTNSKYVTITKSAFYNNGVGLVPNTLDSEPFEPNGTGVIKNNDIFWNNLNYYLPDSPVHTVSGGLGGGVNYPIGIGVALFGSDGWIVKDNNIFGNFMWGVALFSDPLGNEGDDAISRNNVIINNSMGRDDTDTNGQADIYNDGSGGNNCFEGNESSTFVEDESAPGPNHATTEQIYPECPVPSGTQPNPGATGGSLGNIYNQLNVLLPFVSADPPENQECFWNQHSHPPFKDYEAIDVTPGPTCPA